MSDALGYRVDSEVRHFRRRLQAVKGDRSQKRWALELGVPQQRVNCWLTGGVLPRLDAVLRIALVERISLEWLLLGVGPVERPPGGPENASETG